MERPLRQLIGTAAIVGPGPPPAIGRPGVGGRRIFPAQLWVNYLAFVLMPFLMVGLYAVQRPQAGWGVLWGALLYGAAFVYFSFTTLYAFKDRLPITPRSGSSWVPFIRSTAG